MRDLSHCEGQRFIACHEFATRLSSPPIFELQVAACETLFVKEILRVPGVDPGFSEGGGGGGGGG